MYNAQQIKRGDIYYIERFQTTGSEQYSGRPAVIVSNDDNNRYSATVEVVYLTTQPKENLPTHVCVSSCLRDSIAICEQITTVAYERIGDYKGHVTDAEMSEIEAAMLISLELSLPPVQQVSAQNFAKPDKTNSEIKELFEKLRDSEMKCKMLRQMYDALLSKVIGSN